MKYCKNKKRVIIYNICVYVLLAVAVGVISALVFDENTLWRIIGMEAMVIVVAFSFFKLHVAEMNQTIEFGENELICKGFIINGGVADGKIPYESIERITLKNDMLKPFSHCLIVKVKNEKPFAVNDDYIDYRELWKEICRKCKESNPEVNIDEKIYKILKQKDGPLY